MLKRKIRNKVRMTTFIMTLNTVMASPSQSNKARKRGKEEVGFQMRKEDVKLSLLISYTQKIPKKPHTHTHK